MIVRIKVGACLLLLIMRLTISSTILVHAWDSYKAVFQRMSVIPRLRVSLGKTSMALAIE